MRAVQPLSDVGFRILQIGNLVLVRHRRLLASLAHRVDAAVAADEDQPGGGIARWSVLRPTLQGAQACVLECFLRRIEIAEVAQQRPHRLRARGADGVADPGEIAHTGTLTLSNMEIGRIS